MDSIKDLINEKENKIYGSSILKNDERLIDDESNIFDEMKKEYNEEEISDMRNELKTALPDNRVKDRVFTDAISGIKSAEKIEDDSKSISDIIDAKENNGKRISSAGIDLIYNLLNTKPTDEELDSLNTYFKSIRSTDDIYTEDINVLKNILGQRITDKIVTMANENDVGEYEAITRFIIQVYSSYMNVVQFNDDINELYDLVTNVTNILDDENSDIDSVMKQYSILNNATAKLKDLDERNKKLKNDYRVTDFDILILDSVKKCLEEAVTFKRVYDRIDDNPKKLRKDMKDINAVKKSIGNWIIDLKNDPETLYVFPVNDYLTSIESLEGMINYISGFILLQDKNDVLNDYLIDNSDNPVTDMSKYLMENGYVAEKDLRNYENSAILFLYLLSRVFKKKKIKTNDDRRILSYTLDIISKASKVDYASIIMKLINYAATTILKIEEFNYINKMEEANAK